MNLKRECAPFVTMLKTSPKSQKERSMFLEYSVSASKRTIFSASFFKKRLLFTHYSLMHKRCLAFRQKAIRSISVRLEEASKRGDI